MINPILSNFRIEFGSSFFPMVITKKYENFLFHKNYPFKTMDSYLYETIQELNLPGINLNTLQISGIPNLGSNPSKINFPHTIINRSYPGTSSQNEIIEGVTITITLKNTIINWMYCYEVLYKYYKRTREIQDFYILLIMHDSTQIPMIQFKASDCFISGMPGLSFSFLQSFNELKSFDVTFTFNKFDVDFIIPNFNIKAINI
jgi:hypothetical protein